MAKLNDNTTETVEIATDEDVYVPIASTSVLGVASFNSEDFAVSQDGKVSLINKVAGIQFLGTITAVSDNVLTWKISEYSDGDTEAPVVGNKIMLLEDFTYTTDTSTVTYHAGQVFVITSVSAYDTSTLTPVYTGTEYISDMSGDDAEVYISNVTTNTLAAGSTASVTVTDDDDDANSLGLNFTFNIPKGDKGDTGETGEKGDTGDAGQDATVTVNSTTTLAAGESAYVINVGTDTGVILDFGIPQGATGAKGAAGEDGTNGTDGYSCVVFDDMESIVMPYVGYYYVLDVSSYNKTPKDGDSAVGVVKYTGEADIVYYFVVGEVAMETEYNTTLTVISITEISFTEGATVINYDISSANATAETLDAGSDATAIVNASDGVLSFTFGIPKGADGVDGEQGEKGEQGEQGEPGSDGSDGENVYFGTYDATVSSVYLVNSINVSAITWNITPSEGDYCILLLTEYLDSSLSTVVTEVCTGTISNSIFKIEEKTTISSYSVDTSSSISTITTTEIDALFDSSSSDDDSGDSGGTSSSDDPIYGVSWTNDESTTMTRTDDATDLTYSISISYGTIASDFNGVFPWTQASIVTDDNDNVFLQMPEMYFRVDVDDNGDICGVAVSASEHDTGDWYRVAPFWYSCYGGSVSSSLLCSVSGVSRQATTTRANFRTYAANNGDGYCQLDLYHKWVMTFLWWIEFATKDSSSIMTGNIAGSGTGAATAVCTTGNTDSLSTASGFVLSTAQMRWHYIEDFVGNLYEWIDGITWSGNDLYVTTNISVYGDDYSYKDLSGIERDQTSTYGCITAFGWDSSQPFLVYPSKVSGTDYSIGFCDYAWMVNSSCVVVLSGANWVTSGSYPGLVYFDAGYASDSTSIIGGRLLKWLE